MLSLEARVQVVEQDDPVMRGLEAQVQQDVDSGRDSEGQGACGRDRTTTQLQARQAAEQR